MCNEQCTMKALVITTISQQLRRYQFIIHCSLFIISYSFINAQSPTREQLTGTWIGTHYTWDRDFAVPIGSYLQLDASGSYVVGAISELEPPIRGQWSIAAGAMRLDTNQFKAGQVRINNDLLHIDGYFPLTFRRFQDLPMPIDEVRKTLLNKVWTSGAKRCHLHQDGQACMEQSEDRTIHNWSLVNYKNSVFLLIKGVQDNSVGNYQPSLQLTSIQPDCFQAIGWDGEHVSEQSFRAAAVLPPDSVCRPVGFQPCVTYLYRPLNMYYSYDQKGHQERLHFVRSVFRESYKSVAAVGESGLIRIRFQVNCRGEAGRFETLELNSQYEKRPLDQRITRQLLAICQQSLSSGWLPGKNNRDNQASDYFQFITFRLKDGAITEIFP